jgi:hypothetical protein
MRRWDSLLIGRGRTFRLGAAVLDAPVTDAMGVSAAPVLSSQPVAAGDAASMPASYAADSLPSVVMKRRNPYEEQLQV